MDNSEENIRRINRKISSATAALMSNTKWRKLLSGIDGVAHGIQWKFINNDTVFTSSVPPLIEESFGDGSLYPYTPYRNIDWIFIPCDYGNPLADKKRILPKLQNDIVNIKEMINQLGEYPIELSTGGLKISGYKW